MLDINWSEFFRRNPVVPQEDDDYLTDPSLEEAPLDSEPDEEAAPFDDECEDWMEQNRKLFLA